MNSLRQGRILAGMALLLSLTARTYGESKVIDLWNGKPPGAKFSASFPKQTEDSEGGWLKMKSVTKPVMDVYLPEAGKATGAAVVICPGGGYGVLATGHEGKQIAQWLNSLGVAAFVLKYRLPNDAIMKDKSVGPAQDGQKAIRIVRRRAKEWGIHPTKIGVMGFSAGGHLASTLSTHFNEKFYDPEDATSARPDFSLLIYPVISMKEGITHMGSRQALLGNDPSPEKIAHFSNETQVSKGTPPAFLVHSLDDGAVPTANSILYTQALQQEHIPCELHLYQSGGHGYGMGQAQGTESSWPEACRRWLQARGFLEKP